MKQQQQQGININRLPMRLNNDWIGCIHYIITKQSFSQKANKRITTCKNSKGKEF